MGIKNKLNEKLIPNKWNNKFISAMNKYEKINPNDKDKKNIFWIWGSFLKFLLKNLFENAAKLIHNELNKKIEKVEFIFLFLFHYKN